jgi:RimK family alpha-L-glutamate ligase
VESFFFGSKLAMIEWAKREKKPLIVKEGVGSLGTAVFKINTDEELENLLANYSIKTVKTLLVQRFLEGGEDLRVIVLGDKVLGAMKRIAKVGTHLTNYSQGGLVESYDISKDESASKIALDVAKTFELDYCGVDLMKSMDGTWKVLEVNRACQFQGFEKSTGINVAKQVVDYLTK